ncbi:hypothetical protein BCL69_107911 [Nitrosomonas communis]|uniref:Uncharacterized protein n=1 Tax=Nitrosomonas communis TaxID=44574 RepID=A0A5D3YA90_9PROT|nr:hypothetical protein BCL69_107911 [Nitrosomonas communis]
MFSFMPSSLFASRLDYFFTLPIVYRFLTPYINLRAINITLFKFK